MWWGRRVLVVGLALLPLAPPAASQSQTFGKTHLQILKMGYGNWRTFYLSKAGDGTSTNGQANFIYGQCMAERNDRRLGRLRFDHRLRLKTLRRLKNDYNDAVSEVGKAKNGRGTFWVMTDTSLPMDTEEMIEELLGYRSARHRRPPTARTIRRRLAGYRRYVIRHASQIDEMDSSRDALRNLARAAADFDHIAKIAKGLSVCKRAIVLSYCDAALTMLLDHSP